MPMEQYHPGMAYLSVFKSMIYPNNAIDTDHSRMWGSVTCPELSLWESLMHCNEHSIIVCMCRPKGTSSFNGIQMTVVPCYNCITSKFMSIFFFNFVNIVTL